MRRKKNTLLLVLLAGLVFAFGGIAVSATPASAPQWYRSAWSGKERAARVVVKRVALAHELFKAAHEESDKGRRLFLAHKAYEWGSRDLDGYVWAANALNLIQRTDPSQRIESLQQMAGLYESAYRARPNKLRLGSGWGETLMALAQQRLDTAEDRFDIGSISATDALTMLRQCQSDLRRAGRAFQQVIRRAETDARKVRSVGRNDIAQSLDRFVAEFRPKLDDIHRFGKKVADQQGLLARIRGAESRYRIHANAATAEPLALIYVTQLDQPERVGDAMRKLLADPLPRWIMLARRSPKSLTVVQATALAKWYLTLLTTASSEASQLDMATRAALYARRAVTSKSAGAQALLDRATIAASTLGSEAGYFDIRIRDLQARLDWKNAHAIVAVASVGAAGSVGATKSTASATSSSVQSTRVSSTAPPASASTPSTSATSTSTSASSSVAGRTASGGGGKVVIVNGRPMIHCAKCGRLFFAGWGDEHPTLCPRCRSGRKNIFDFGKE